MRYPARFEPHHGAGGFVVTFPDFDGGVTQGETLEEAYEMAEDLLATIVGHYLDTGQPLLEPVERRTGNWHMVRLPLLVDAKAELYRAFLQSSLPKAQLAPRTGIQEAIACSGSIIVPGLTNSTPPFALWGSD